MADQTSVVLRGGTVLTLDAQHSVLPGADVLVAIVARAQLGLGVVEVDHLQATDADARIERLQEIVGDVRDEHDDATPDVVEMRDGWRVSGLLRIDEVETETPFRPPEGEYETIGGLILQELGHIPEPGESVELTEFDPDGPLDDPVHWQAKVIQMDGRRIDLLELTELGRRGKPDREN